ncbi:hypothetical protein KDD93_09185 [Campylobacter sp. faydin G-24]|uniref:Uncharacterized protein n=1 Tax=Campylobacter anatolicus TaxID=2829105 RepID=A0ABS5HKM8_9BACT|nr:hypothetical protein [Campylobacter anatolicus]MBR8464728.1 hypothetical protein [Campylobacter anatolicus]MBR8466333.1 hypothetical protein [Campylobacter anatolicus]
MLAFMTIFTSLFLLFYFIPTALYVVLGLGFLAIFIGALGFALNTANKTLEYIKSKAFK